MLLQAVFGLKIADIYKITMGMPWHQGCHICVMFDSSNFEGFPRGWNILSHFLRTKMSVLFLLCTNELARYQWTWVLTKLCTV
jgi:hypothetical protein